MNLELIWPRRRNGKSRVNPSAIGMLVYGDGKGHWLWGSCGTATGPPLIVSTTGFKPSASAECFSLIIRLGFVSSFFSRLQSAKEPTGFHPVVVELNFTAPRPGVDWVGWKYVESAIPPGRTLPLKLDLPVRYIETDHKGMTNRELIPRKYGS